MLLSDGPWLLLFDGPWFLLFDGPWFLSPDLSGELGKVSGSGSGSYHPVVVHRKTRRQNSLLYSLFEKTPESCGPSRKINFPIVSRPELNFLGYFRQMQSCIT